MGKRTNIGSRLHSVERGNVVAGANEILDDAKGKKQNVINNDVDAELVRLDQSKQDNLTFDNQPTEGSDNPVKSGGVYAADKALSDAIEAILILIPSAATALNQLADKNFVNSSIATDTATFRGTSETGLSEAQFIEWANSLTHDMNDYVFWQTIDEAGNTLFKRYKWNGTQWLYEYTLNNSSFTADQWAAIMSGITSALVEKLNGLPTNAALQQALNSKQDALTFDNVPTENSTNPVKSGGVYSAVKTEEDARLNLAQMVSGIGGEVSQIEDVIPTGATSINKLVENASMEAYVASIIQNITSSFTLSTADGHINLTLTQTNGQVATLTLSSSDIASAQDVANLQQLYNNLQQSKPVPVTALPETGQQQGVIYRLAGTTSYSDYMWNGSTWVLMATYNNAIDPRPKKASQNLVTSGGVFDNMGALDVSELNATENPHTLAQYVDLSAALVSVPTDYQKGGMSIKYVQSSDNKYIQYRLMSDTFNTTVANWQGVDDEPTAGSDNLVKSGGVVTFGEQFLKKEDITIYGDSTQRSSGGGGQNIGLLISSEGILKRINVNIAESSTVILRVYDQVDGEIIYNESFSGSAGINHFSLAQNIRILPGYIVSVEGKVMYNSTVLDQIFYQYSNNQWSLRTDKARFQYYIEVDESILKDLDKLQDEIDDVNDYLKRNAETVIIGDSTTRKSGGGSQNVGLLVPKDGKVSEISCNVSGNGTIEVSVYDTDKSTLLITKVYSVIDGVNTISVSDLSVKQGDIISVKGNLYYNSTQLDQIFYQYFNGQWSLRTDKARFQVSIKIESVDVITELQNEIDAFKSDNIIYVGSNREIKKVTDALALGLQKPNSVIILDSEEFDIIDELGDDYMSQSFTGAEDSRGIELYNNITIKGTGNSVIKAHYLGSNADARSKFSVFNTKGSFTLDNIILDCKNIRYCVHDEQGNRTVPYKVQYLGCSMKIDNSENNDWPAMQCIGGGLGKNGIIIIKDCVFDAVLTTEYFRDSIGCVTYHNNGYDANSKSNLIVNGNYFKASTFALMWYGSSTKITECLLSNNSFETPVLEKATTQSATVVNTKIIGWNNIIRGVGN